MPQEAQHNGDLGVLRLGRPEKLVLLERIAVIVIVVGVAAIDLFGLVTTPDADVLLSLTSIAASASFLLFLWSPLFATIALGVVFGFSFLVDAEVEVLTAAAVAAVLVLRLGATPLILSYAGGFLVATAITVLSEDRLPAAIGIYLVIAAAAGGIGLALRLAFARGSRLEQELARSAEQERQAVLAERRWIAGELHDSIAHHLTVVSLHVQMLDDDTARPASQEAIRTAARKAMTDLRFVIELADDGPRAAGMQTGDLAAAIEEAAGEIGAAGHPLEVSGDARDDRIPRSAEIILARIVRESATNILKHAGPGVVRIRLDVDDDVAALEIGSPMPAVPRRDLPSSRTGVDRMAERVLGASGSFDAGERDGEWVVTARLPLSRPMEAVARSGRKS